MNKPINKLLDNANILQYNNIIEMTKLVISDTVLMTINDVGPIFEDLNEQ